MSMPVTMSLAWQKLTGSDLAAVYPPAASARVPDRAPDAFDTCFRCQAKSRVAPPCPQDPSTFRPPRRTKPQGLGDICPPSFEKHDFGGWGRQEPPPHGAGRDSFSPNKGTIPSTTGKRPCEFDSALDHRHDRFAVLPFSRIRTMHLRHVASALFLAALLTPSVGRAQASSQVSDEDRATARALLIKGNDALDKKDYLHALNYFERADALYHAPTILIGLARSRAGAQKLVGAREAYNRILNETLPPNASPAFLKAIEDARAELTALLPRVPSVVINVQGVDASKVSATIDGVSISAAALGIERPTDPAPMSSASAALGSKQQSRSRSRRVRPRP